VVESAIPTKFTGFRGRRKGLIHKEVENNFPIYRFAPNTPREPINPQGAIYCVSSVARSIHAIFSWASSKPVRKSVVPAS
jgi:hypothetical protein